MKHHLAPKLAASLLWLASHHAHADLCAQVQDTKTEPESAAEVAFYKTIFPDTTRHGNDVWNRIIVECNRQRDHHANELSKLYAAQGSNDAKTTLASKELRAKVIRGRYNFFGDAIKNQKYRYVLSRKAGVWQMIVPYKPIINDVVAGRIDFDMGGRAINDKTGKANAEPASGHATIMYEASQVLDATRTSTTLKATAQSIDKTLCSSFKYFPGDEGKYDGQNNENAYKRDRENRHVSLGLIQHRYGQKTSDKVWEGCRVDANKDLYWRPDTSTSQVVRIKPADWILDNFIQTAQAYWSIDKVFELKLLLQGRNEAQFDPDVLKLLGDDDFLTVRFATKFMANDHNQMYKSNIVQLNNFSTMTTNGTYWHEVGHAFGLDDEYGKDKEDKDTGDTIYKEDGCDAKKYEAFGISQYQMCTTATVTPARTIYHYIAVSRYVAKENECASDPDCLGDEYCDKGFATAGKNQCLPKKATDEACDVAGGGHQCASGQCSWGHCYAPGTVAMGGTCYQDGACKVGKCSASDGFKGTCVCKKDEDCANGQWCDAGLDTKVNVCRAKLNKGEKCGDAMSFGNDHRCKSGKCSGLPNYKCK